MTGRKPTSTARQDASSSGRRPVVNSGSSWVATMQGEPRRLHTWSRERSLAIVWSTWAPLTSARARSARGADPGGVFCGAVAAAVQSPPCFSRSVRWWRASPERHNLVPIDRHRPGPAACS